MSQQRFNNPSPDGLWTAGKADVWQDDAQEVEPRKIDALEEEAQAVASRNLDFRALGSQALDSRALESQELDSQALESQALESQALDSRNLDSQALESQGLESQALDSQDLDSQDLDSREADAQRFDVQAMGSQDVDASKTAAEAADSQKKDDGSLWIEKQRAENADQDSVFSSGMKRAAPSGAKKTASFGEKSAGTKQNRSSGGTGRVIHQTRQDLAHLLKRSESKISRGSLPKPGAGTQLSFPILGDAPQPGRAGGDKLDSRNGVDYFDLPIRSILTWVDGTHMSKVYSINPYRGCELGCSYCYARYTHEFMELPDWEAFERQIFVKGQAARALRRELASSKQILRHGIAIGTATDPYQPAELRFGITRQILETLLPHSGIPLSLTTKSGLIVRDLELLAKLAQRHRLKVYFSCISRDPKLIRAIERRSPVADLRFRAMKALSEAGISCELLLMPILPGISDSEENLESVIGQARLAGAKAVHSRVLWLSDSSRKRYMPWLKANFPELWSQYQEAFGDGQMYTARRYRHLIAKRVEKLLLKQGFAASAAEPGQA